MAKVKSLDEMSVSMLQAELDRLNAERDALKDRAREVAAALNKRLSEAEAVRKAHAMSDQELAAVAQVIRSRGIESGEVFGVIG